MADDTETLAEMCDRLSVPSFIRPELDRWLAARDAAVAERAWQEGYDVGMKDRVLLDVYPDLGRKINPYRADPS